jgi:hypothetical protein
MEIRQSLGKGNSRDTSVRRTQQEAIEAAKEIALNQIIEVLIHGRDGWDPAHNERIQFTRSLTQPLILNR